ncbi:hypothetical protein NPIL_100831 [Nephila pilipes]|uniref:Uncharacterized protein n=1 Tax=Nephila pilipes TaxID=299642 RepID=A0A8X6MDC9_NEPPI|nr:hypothetical protein NPIL_100831 [Nephila pilipes]
MELGRYLSAVGDELQSACHSSLAPGWFVNCKEEMDIGHPERYYVNSLDFTVTPCSSAAYIREKYNTAVDL